MVRTQIYLPADLHQLAKTVAEKNDESLANLIRRHLSQGLAVEKKSFSLASLAELNIEAGPTDLSENFDNYLYGFPDDKS